MKVKPQIDFTGRQVLIVDDILDEGHTLCEIFDYCKAEGASDVYTLVLTDKKHDRKARPSLKSGYTALELKDRYVFGYGMDYKGY